MDSAGKIVISPKFNEPGPFSEGLAVASPFSTVDQPGYLRKGYIDKSGKFVVQPKFVRAGSFSEALAAVCENPCNYVDVNGLPSGGYINRKGDYVISPRFEGLHSFSDGFARVSKFDLKIGAELHCDFIDKQGHLLFGFRFGDVTDFGGGAALAEGFGVIDKRGKVLLPGLRSLSDSSFRDGWAVALDGNQLVYVDTSGVVRLRTRFSEASSFSEGLAAACLSNCGDSAPGKNWGFIDHTGKFVIKPQFVYKPYPFSEGFALVTTY